MGQPTFRMERPRTARKFDNYMNRGMGRQLPFSGPVGGPLPPTGRTLGGDFVRIGDLPGAKPPPHMMDTIHDVLGIGDRRKERYLAETQGGHPNMSEYGYNMQEGLGSLYQGLEEAPYREEAAMDLDEDLLKLDRLENFWNMDPDWEYNPEDLIIDPFDENQLFGHTSKVAALRPDGPFGGSLPTGSPGPYYPGNPEGIMQMAGLTQTWQKIKDKLGEAAANDWLASQQAV